MKKTIFTSLLLLASIFIGHSQSVKHQLIDNILEEKFRLGSSEKMLENPRSFFKALNASSVEQKITTNTSSSEEEGEPYILINPTDSNNIVLSYMAFGGASNLDFPIYYSFDRGQSWSLSDFSAPDVFASDSLDMVIGGGGDPMFAFDNNGKLYFSWIYLGVNMTTFDAMFTAYWAWSDNKGASFQVEEGDNHHIAKGDISLISQELGTIGDGIFDRQWFDIDRSGGAFDGTLYCTGMFMPNTTTTIAGAGMVCKYKRPTDTTFTYFNAPVSPNQNVQFGNVRVDNQGNVHVTYGDLDGDNIMHSKSTDGGLTFSTPQIVASCFWDETSSTRMVHDRENPVPNLAIDLNDNSLHLVWTSFENNIASGYYSYSSDNGTTWSSPVNIAHFFADTVDQVLMPTIAVNETGAVSISGHALNANDGGTFFVSHSVDGITAFGEPLIVSGDSTFFQDYPISSNPMVPSAFFGDYEGSAYAGSKTLSIWSDGRAAQGPKVYLAITDHSQPTTGISELIPVTDAISVSNIFPNPAIESISFDVDLKNTTDLHVDILGLNGATLANLKHQSYPQGLHKLNIVLPTDMAAGQYYLSIQSNKGRILKAFFKK